MAKVNWLKSEKVVTIIERHLGKNSKVQHNVRLPVLKSKSHRKRQCDIVIIQGERPRQSISIVEVQKRNSKPEINEFNGWVEKMKEVGAQHLLCVSDHGFPDSIEERADELGPSVRLITLKQLNKDWPIPPSYLSTKIRITRYEKLVGLKMELIHLVKVNPNDMKVLPNPKDKIYRLNGSKLISLTDLLDFHNFSNPKNMERLPVKKYIYITVDFPFEKINYYLEYMANDEGWIRLKSLKISYIISIFMEKLEWETLSYEQRGWGNLGWILNSKFKAEGKEEDIVVPVINIGPGKYRLGTPVVLNDKDAFSALIFQEGNN